MVLIKPHSIITMFGHLRVGDKSRNNWFMPSMPTQCKSQPVAPELRDPGIEDLRRVAHQAALLMWGFTKIGDPQRRPPN